MDIYKIKRGLDLRLTGEAQHSVVEAKPSSEYALRPLDFLGVTPKVLVKEGVAVLAGTPLFVDKATEKVKFVAPVSGIVTNVERGERRKLLSIRIQPDTVQAAKTFEIPTAGQRNAENMTALLLETGLFGYLRQRPYDVVPSPEVAPRDIFVSAFSTMPLAADFSFVVSGQEEDFKFGVNPEQLNTKLLPIEAENVEVACFKGLNPAGNVGVQINKIAPVNKGEVVWTLAPEIVAVLGRLLRTGQVDFTRTIAVAGSEVTTPQYVKAKVGAKLSDVLANNLKPADHSVRIINGNPFVGEKATTEDFLAAHSTEITVIPEGDDVNEVLGWICPRLNQFSVNRSYFSWLLGKKEYNLDSRIKGGARHMIMSGEYESVFPMDIYPSYLVKAIITGDIDQQEALGIYEVAPEDFAPAEFVCSSKLELQRIVREGLEILRKENA